MTVRPQQERCAARSYRSLPNSLSFQPTREQTATVDYTGGIGVQDINQRLVTYMVTVLCTYLQYIYIHTYTYIYTHTRAHIHTYRHCTCLVSHMCVCACIYIYIYIYIHCTCLVTVYTHTSLSHMCVCTHTHTHCTCLISVIYTQYVSCYGN